jgi:hypothetical protein
MVSTTIGGRSIRSYLYGSGSGVNLSSHSSMRGTLVRIPNLRNVPSAVSMHPPGIGAPSTSTPAPARIVWPNCMRL